jgi:hypothetical protein
MEAKDTVKSSGEKRGSVDDELQNIRVRTLKDQGFALEPHSQKVLHDEFVYGLCRVCHINLALSVTKVCL